MLHGAGGDEEGEKGACGHEDGGEEGVHLPHEAEDDGGEVVEDGEGKNEVDGVASPLGVGEEAGEKFESGGSEEEVGLLIEDGFIGDGGGGEGGILEGEGVVRSIANVETGEVTELHGEVRLFRRG